MNQIGLIGLAVMGQNLARNFANNGIKTVVYNRTTETMENFISDFGSETLVGEKNVEDFVKSIERPRKIILMVQAGGPVDKVIEGLLPYLEEGDIVIDGGNSLYTDTIRREKEYKEKGIRFIGCGISGGEEGALNGPSIMPGGEKDAVDALLPLFEKVAAKDFSGGKCVTNVGADGAGHFVKMVHNGVEYAIMQFLAETYDLLKTIYPLSGQEISDIFGEWNKGRLESFLVELSEKITKTKDAETGEFLLEKVQDKAGQKGTGRWTVLAAVERGIAIPTITAALDARVFSSQKDLRTRLSKKISTPEAILPHVPLEEFTVKLEEALYASMILAYSEGFWLINETAKEQGWNLDYSEISRIWQGGCIIRSVLLSFLEKTFKESNAQDKFLEIPEIAKEMQDGFPSLGMICTAGIMSNISIPGFLAALSHLRQVTRERGSANFLQGLRDSFGAHTYKRIDKEGSFHSEW